jgi:hypothetical protein
MSWRQISDKPEKEGQTLTSATKKRFMKVSPSRNFSRPFFSRPKFLKADESSVSDFGSGFGFGPFRRAFFLGLGPVEAATAFFRLKTKTP